MNYFKIIGFLFFFNSLPCEGSVQEIYGPIPIENKELDQWEVYLWTFHPGQEIPSRWGHNALQVVHRQDGSFDRLYNWGTYDFYQDYFILNFIRGRLWYTLSVSSSQDSLRFYRMLKRDVERQKLGLTGDQKYRLFSQINENLDPENLAYRYDARTSNCSTKVRDNLSRALGGQLEEETQIVTELTFRDHLRHRIADYSSIAVGLDLVLNGPIDQPMTEWELMFLPEHLPALIAKHAPSLGIEVGKPEMLLQFPDQMNLGSYHWDLLYRLWLGLGLILILLALVNLKWSPKENPLFPKALSAALGAVISALSILFLFLWFFTDHQDAHANPLLWLLWPTDWLLAGQKLFRLERLVKPYIILKLSAFLLFALLILLGQIERSLGWPTACLAPMLAYYMGYAAYRHKN